MSQRNNRILLVAYNRVPSETVNTVEGTGLRYYRIAKGLETIGYKDIDIAVHEKFKQNERISKAIKTIGFNEKSIKGLIKKYDIIVFSHGLGHITKQIYSYRTKDQVLITDIYSPFAVEYLTGPNYIENDYRENLIITIESLLMSDYSLYASESQKLYYTGLLAGIGALPIYNLNRLVYLPGYIERSEIEKDTAGYSLDKKKITLLWWGGMYPWFNPLLLINCISNKNLSKRIKLIVVGAKNPYYPDDASINEQYTMFHNRVKDLKLDETIIEFREWIDYKSRIDLFKECDIAISLNQTTSENSLSFRIRIADMAANGLPIITNGGDPVSEYLISKNASIKIESEKIEEELLKIISEPKVIDSVKMNLNAIKDELYIDRYIDNLSEAIKRQVTKDYRSLNKDMKERSLILSFLYKYQAATKTNKRIENKISSLSSEVLSLKKEISEIKSSKKWRILEKLSINK